MTWVLKSLRRSAAASHNATGSARNLRKPLHHPQNGRLPFQPRQVIPDTEMRARAKRQVLIVCPFQI
jgi:hypothetical protein